MAAHLLKIIVADKAKSVYWINEGDDDFATYSTVLFQKQAEHYLDPESLAMTSAHIARRLKALL